jgi:hypothetical protein
VMIKFAKQIFLCANGVMGICGRSEELAFALLAASHSGNLALISQNDEVALCHGADSLSQRRRLYHDKELRPEVRLARLRAGSSQEPLVRPRAAKNCTRARWDTLIVIGSSPQQVKVSGRGQ